MHADPITPPEQRESEYQSVARSCFCLAVPPREQGGTDYHKTDEYHLTPPPPEAHWPFSSICLVLGTACSTFNYNAVLYFQGIFIILILKDAKAVVPNAKPVLLPVIVSRQKA